MMRLSDLVREMRDAGMIIAPPLEPDVLVSERFGPPEVAERQVSDKHIEQIKMISKDRKRRLAIEQRKTTRWGIKIDQLKKQLALEKDQRLRAESELKKSIRSNELIQGMLSVREDSVVELMTKYSEVRQTLEQLDKEISVLRQQVASLRFWVNVRPMEGESDENGSGSIEGS